MDASLVIAVLVAASVFSAAQGLWGLVRVAGAKRAVNRRLAVAERSRGGIAELVVELRKQRGLAANGEQRGGIVWLSRLITRSGVPYAPRRWALWIGAAVVAGGVAAALAGRSAIFAPAGMLLAGTAGPLLFLQVMAGRRAAKLSSQLPQALEMVVRSLEAGHPVPTAVALVGREMSDPIGSEFGMAADEISYGATLEQAVGRMAERCQHPDLDLFAATVRLQERAGGNLTGLLRLNAGTVRERAKMRLKIKAASSEGRVSAMILTAAPLAAGGFITVASPDFYGSVIHEPVVRWGLAGLGVWMAIGNLVIRQMISMRV